ncbi:UNVERIFIED_CONTAM: hypothetical protein Sindi_1289600 [Sesamum indicum]
MEVRIEEINGDTDTLLCWHGDKDGKGIILDGKVVDLGPGSSLSELGFCAAHEDETTPMEAEKSAEEDEVTATVMEVVTMTDDNRTNGEGERVIPIEKDPILDVEDEDLVRHPNLGFDGANQNENHGERLKSSFNMAEFLHLAHKPAKIVAGNLLRQFETVQTCFPTVLPVRDVDSEVALGSGDVDDDVEPNSAADLAPRLDENSADISIAGADVSNDSDDSRAYVSSDAAADVIKDVISFLTTQWQRTWSVTWRRKNHLLLPYKRDYTWFKSVADIKDIIEGGPWLFQGQPILLQKWEPGMVLRKLKHTQVPVWVKLRHLSVELWTEEGLSIVASGVGKPLYPDAITRACTRLDFARVCVMLDVNSKMPKHIIIMTPDEEGGELPCKVDVEYEWLPPRCTSLGALRGPMVTERTRDHPTPHTAAKQTEDRGTRPTAAGPSREEIGKEIVTYNSFDALQLLDSAEGSSRDIIEVGNQFIHCFVTIRALQEYVDITIVYGATKVSDRRELWASLESLAVQCINIPWLVGGDFNAVRDLSEYSTNASLHGHRITRRWWLMGIISSDLERRNKGDLSHNVELARGFLEQAQVLVSSHRQDELILLLKHCSRLVYAKAAELERIMLQQTAKME